MTDSLLLRDVEVEGRRTHVLVSRGRVVELGTDPRSHRGDVIEGHGGALLPGLHDHHLHLNAMAAERRSLNLATDAITSPTQLGDALRNAAGDGWIRAVGYHESLAGPLDRDRLDEWISDRPVRVQHRSGALWMLNSRAVREVSSALDDSPDVERWADGRPTGRLWRYDQRLLSALPDESDEQRSALRAVAARLRSRGITGVTDATPDLDDAALDMLTAVHPLRVHVLGIAPESQLPPGFSRGPRKILLRDHDLPTYADLVALLDPMGHGVERRPVAVHCVTRESLILTVAAWREIGSVRGDRIEHGAITPPELDEELAALGLCVVTQSDFIRTRGDLYLREVSPDDQPYLYRWAGLARAGVRVAGSSDAPYGDVDPWQVIRSAGARRTRTGVVISGDEGVDAETALTSYLSTPEDPGGTARRVRPGAVADLCLLTRPLVDVLRDPRADWVRLTLVDGKVD